VSTEEEQIQQRRSNLAELERLGVNAYPHRFERTATISDLVKAYSEKTGPDLEAQKVETITSLAKRRLKMSIGIVTTTEVEDATPAAMVAHTRRRGAYDEIVEQLFAARPDVSPLAPRSPKNPRRVTGMTASFTDLRIGTGGFYTQKTTSGVVFWETTPDVISHTS